MPTSKAIQQLDQQLAALPPGTVRYEALDAARRFKASWIDLGRILWTVWREKAFRGWGYLTFETYCAKELRIKTATAKKLLHSYAFLEREEPTVLRRIAEGQTVAPPHYDAVNVLRLVQRRQDVPPTRYQTLRAQVLDEGREAADVRREFRAAQEAAHPDPEAARAARRQATIRRMVGTLKALHLELRAAKLLPQKLLTEIESLTQKLEATL